MIQGERLTMVYERQYFWRQNRRGGFIDMSVRLGIDGTDEVWGAFISSMNGIMLCPTILPGRLSTVVLSENMFDSADNAAFEAAWSVSGAVLVCIIDLQHSSQLHERQSISQAYLQSWAISSSALIWNRPEMEGAAEIWSTEQDWEPNRGRTRQLQLSTFGMLRL